MNTLRLPDSGVESTRALSWGLIESFSKSDLNDGQDERSYAHDFPE